MTAVEFLKQSAVLKQDEEDRVVMTAGGTVSLVKLLTQFADVAEFTAGEERHLTEVPVELKPDAVVVTSAGDKDAEGSAIEGEAPVKNTPAKTDLKKRAAVTSKKH